MTPFPAAQAVISGSAALTRLPPSDVSSAEPFSRVIAAVKLSAPLYIGEPSAARRFFCSPFSAAYSPQTA